MNNLKILAAAAGLAVAAGVTTAGSIFVNGTQVGTYDNFSVDANGRLDITSPDFDGGGDGTGPNALIGTPSCTNLTCTFNGSGSTGSGLSYQWTFGGAGNVTAGSSTSASVTFAYSSGGTYTVSLTVTDSNAETDTASRSVSVTEGGGGGGPAECDGIGLDSTWTLDTSPSSFPVFPPSLGSFKLFELQNGEYNAIEFTPTTNYSGFVNFDRHNNAQNAQKVIAISRCPGDFASQLADGKAPNKSSCRRASDIPSMYMDTGDLAAFWECPLEIGQTYYLNVVHATGDGNNLSNSCTSASEVCGGHYIFY